MSGFREASGPPNRGYKLRFDVTARALEQALELLGAEVCVDATGLAYIVTKGDRIIGGPASGQELAMYDAVRTLRERRT